ncbi:MAG TPA: hypothetical protein VK843_00400 [Planctomycetota bacterium]|nr:hypothetical protein [Planctomycetota bacterium]
MPILASVRLRLFLVSWILFSLFFATNIVREHYPAFTLIEHGDFRCDEYLGWHADIFQHTDGHSYVGNNVMGSVIAAVPLLVFDPVLDRIEAYSQRKLAESSTPIDTTYATKYPNRANMYKAARLAGKDLRLGASAVVTSVFLMAPLSALFTLLVYSFLLRRSVPRSRAVWLALLFAFGTPIWYRTAHLNHNMFLMEALFGAFLILFGAPDRAYEPSLRRRLWAGFLLGLAVSLDYAGAIPAVILGLYFLWNRAAVAGLRRALTESLPALLAALPPIAFLLWSQKIMYGGWFTPGQFVMRPVNYTEVGMKGISWPSPEVFLKNLIAPGWGLYTFGPLLLIALWPAPRKEDAGWVLPRRERRWVLALIVAFLLFNAANIYSLMQFNSGFRYLLPIVPFAFLQASGHLARMGRTALAIVSVLVIGHGLVLCMTREVNDTEKILRDRAVAEHVSETELPGYWRAMLTETPVPLSYRRVFHAAAPEDAQGVQLPWLTVLAQTRPDDARLRNPFLPAGLIMAAVAACLVLWLAGQRLERAQIRR